MLLLTKFYCLLYLVTMASAYKKLRARVTDIQGKIVGGKNARITDFPYMVRLLISVNEATVACGGSYIRPMWTLTAAHCLDTNDRDTSFPPEVGNDLSRVECIMGMETKQDTDFQAIKSQNLFIHPEYFRNDSEVLNDIGLIHLEKQFELSEKVQLIATPTKKMDYSNYKVTIMGWGATGIQDRGKSITRPMILQSLTTFAHDMEDCETMTGSGHAICIGQKGEISCSGDSGGPLVFEMVVIGVCSYGFGCSGEFAVYENVYSHREWINSLAGNETCRPRECSKLRYSGGASKLLALIGVYATAFMVIVGAMYDLLK